jgi:tetratricopeptide (TPR) repeat protein
MPEAHVAMAYILAYYEHRWLAADSAIERATRIAPRMTLAHLRRASINTVLGRADVAMASLDRAQELEPTSWVVLYNRGIVASALGRSKEAIKYFQAASVMEPSRRYIKYDLANELWVDGQTSEAAEIYRSIGMLNQALIAEGDTVEMRRLVRRHETDSITMQPTNLARIYARLGERDKAFRALKDAVRKDRFLAMQIRVPPLAWLKEDRRYDQVMRDLGLQ